MSYKGEMLKLRIPEKGGVIKACDSVYLPPRILMAEKAQNVL